MLQRNNEQCVIGAYYFSCIIYIVCKFVFNYQKICIAIGEPPKRIPSVLVSPTE